MNAHSLEQIATALERIESHLAVIARLLAARQGVQDQGAGRLLAHQDGVAGLYFCRREVRGPSATLIEKNSSSSAQQGLAME